MRPITINRLGSDDSSFCSDFQMLFSIILVTLPETNTTMNTSQFRPSYFSSKHSNICYIDQHESNDKKHKDQHIMSTWLFFLCQKEKHKQLIPVFTKTVNPFSFWWNTSCNKISTFSLTGREALYNLQQ